MVSERSLPEFPAGREAGFTLLELLVVLFIIGLTVTFATLSFSGRAMDDRLHNEARRLQEIMRLAGEDAVLQGLELGMHSDGEKYGFLVIAEEGWAPYQEDTPLREHKLPDGIHLEVTVEDFSLPVPEENELLPQIIFLSSGELTPFDLTLSAETAKSIYRFQGQLTGVVKMEELDANSY